MLAQQKGLTAFWGCCAAALLLAAVSLTAAVAEVERENTTTTTHIDSGHRQSDTPGHVENDHSANDILDENEEDDDHDGHEDEGIIEITPAAVEMAGITLATADRGRISQAINLPGEVGFDEDRLVHITPRFGGIARETRFRVGDYVNAGDTVAIVESNESLNTYAITALISGRIIDRHVTLGEFISEEHCIYTIADLSDVWVNLAVYPRDADRVKPGQQVVIRAIGSEHTAEGMIQYVTPILNVTTRSITARVVLPNPDDTWRPGTFVQARVTTGSGEEGLLVDNHAIQMLDDENIVFVSDGPGRYRPVAVTVGERDDRFTEILSGLEEGTKHVVSGAFELKAKIVTSSLGGHAGHGH
jgi:cobalt-zinc-cadmium efflux system membrane fusion protein